MEKPDIARVGSYAGDACRRSWRRRRKKKNTRAIRIRVPMIDIGRAMASLVFVDVPFEFVLGAAVELFVASDEVEVIVVDDAVLVVVVRSDVLLVKMEVEVSVGLGVVIVDVSEAVKYDDRSDDACEIIVPQMLSQSGTVEASAVCDGAIVIGIS